LAVTPNESLKEHEVLKKLPSFSKAHTLFLRFLIPSGQNLGGYER
jgi:hypothetical protein